MKTILLILTLFLITQTIAQENYGDYTLTELSTDYLKTRPGQIQISPNYLTIIEFENLVTNVATGKADILSIEVMDDVLLIKPTRSSGQTDLIVFSEGNTLLFEITIDNGNIPRRYKVVSGGVTTSTTADSNRLANAASIVSTTTSSNSYQTSNVPYRGTTSSTVTALPYPLAPQWIRKNITVVRNGSELAINYSFSNEGNNQLTVDPSQLRLTTTGSQLSYTQTSVSNNNSLATGQTEYGVILIMAVPEDTNITLQWSLTEIGTQNTWLIQENFQQ